MPYIPPEDRKKFSEYQNLDLLLSDFGQLCTSAGELNFAITQLIKGYQKLHGTKYSTMNDIMGALEGSKLEYYRRVVAPYENVKLSENGDVY
jgi:hypothetical protein